VKLIDSVFRILNQRIPYHSKGKTTAYNPLGESDTDN